MPGKLINTNGHLLGFDDKTGKYYIVELKYVPMKSIPEEELTDLMKAISTNTAIIWEDP
jgi:hypothetical protein